MVRIGVDSEGAAWVVRVSGHLAHSDVLVFMEACGSVPGPLRVDLSELRGLEESGAAALRTIRDAGAEVIGASPYVRMRLSKE